MHRVPASGRDEETGRQSPACSRDVQIPPLGLAGILRHPAGAHALVIFAHGSGSSRFSPRNIQVAEALNRRKIQPQPRVLDAKVACSAASPSKLMRSSLRH